MEVNGPFAHLLRFHRPTAAGRDPGMPSAGTTVTVTVERYLGKGVWLLDLGGSRLEARSHLSLTPGDQFSALVTREGDSLLLVSRSRREDSFAALLRNAGLPENTFSRSLISLLFSTGSAPKPELLSRLAAALRRRREGGASPRLAAESVSRGFRETPEALESLLAALTGLGGGQERREGEKRRDQNGEERPGGDGGDAPGELRRAVLRTTATGDHPLQLYNHLALRGSRWISLPVGFTASEPSGGSESRFTGVLHLRIGEGGGVAGEGGGAWTVDVQDGRYRFIIAAGGDNRLAVRVTAAAAGTGGEAGASKVPDAEAAARSNALARRLTEAGYRVESGEQSFDGIEFRDHSDLHEGIDLLQ